MLDMLDCHLSRNGKGPVIMMNQLQSIYNGPFKDSRSHLIRACFPMIAGNV